MSGQDVGQVDDIVAAEALVSYLYRPTTAGVMLSAIREAGFDETAYYNANQDLVTAFPSARRAALHFLAMVKSEHRAFPLILQRRALDAIGGLEVADRSMVVSLLASLANAVTEMGPFPDVQRLEKIWDYASAFGRLGGCPYIIVGDSHSTFYRRTATNKNFFLVPYHVCCTGGSALGLGNNISRSGFRQQIQALASVSTYLLHGQAVPILIQFGQVDLEFVHSFRRSKAGIARFEAEEHARFRTAVIAAYISFLRDVFLVVRRNQVTIMGVFPPRAQRCNVGGWLRQRADRVSGGRGELRGG